MQIKINGEYEEFTEANLSVASLLEIKQVESPDMVSVQLNEKFIDKKDYGITVLSENDTLEFLYFMGGGSF